MYNKTWITWFNKNKTKDLYRKYIGDVDIKYKKCRICDDVIYYSDSSFILDRQVKKLKLKGKSYLSKKTLFDVDYCLTVCEDCLIKKYSKYENMNKSRIFNNICDITLYAFEIPKKISNEWIKKKLTITLDNLINKYGDEEGKKRWDIYKIRQRKQLHL